MDEWDFTDEGEVVEQDGEPMRDSAAWVRRLVGRLGNVRIHDTAQAGELVSRLGARAFTVGRDVYVRPDLMRPANARSMALLAHELFHVGEQTGVDAQSSMDMPLMMRGGGSATRASGGGSSGGGARGGVPVQREAATASTIPASLPRSEVAAEAIESAVVRQGDGANANRREDEEPPNREDIADKVYGMIARDLMLDRERAAYGW